MQSCSDCYARPGIRLSKRIVTLTPPGDQRERYLETSSSSSSRGEHLSPLPSFRNDTGGQKRRPIKRAIILACCPLARLICRIVRESSAPGFISIYVEQYAKQETARRVSLLRDCLAAPRRARAHAAPPCRRYFVINSFDLYRQRTRNANSYLLISRACEAAGWPISFYELSENGASGRSHSCALRAPSSRTHSSRAISPIARGFYKGQTAGCRCASARNTADN